MTPTQYYARSENHTKLVMSYEKSSISQLECIIVFFTICLVRFSQTMHIARRIYRQDFTARLVITPRRDVWGTAPRRL